MEGGLQALAKPALSFCVSPLPALQPIPRRSDQWLGWRSGIPAAAELLWKQRLPSVWGGGRGDGGWFSRTEAVCGGPGRAPRRVFSANLPTKAVTQVQQTIEPATRHVMPAKLLAPDFLRVRHHPQPHQHTNHPHPLPSKCPPCRWKREARLCCASTGSFCAIFQDNRPTADGHRRGSLCASSCRSVFPCVFSDPSLPVTSQTQVGGG